MGGRLSTPSHTERDQGPGQANGGRSYSGFLISDHARVHNGDQYIVQNYYSSSVPSPDTFSHDISSAASVLESRKRKRLEDGNHDGVRLDANRNLHSAANQLGEFSLSLQHSKQDQDAQRVARWIMIVLDAIETEVGRTMLEHTGAELTSMRDGLAFINRVCINSLPKKQRAALLKRKRKTSAVLVGGLQIFLDTLTWTSLDEMGEHTIETMSTLRVVSAAKTSAGGSNFAVLFGERTDSAQRSVIYPTIVAFRVLEQSSGIFRLLMASDDVDGLIKLLSTQEATLRDCDDTGMSILGYACMLNRLKCLKFLIEHGADVNRMEYVCSNDGQSDAYLMPLLSFTTSDSSTREPLAFECSRFLIKAGADSTMRVASEQLSLQDRVGHQGSVLLYYLTRALGADLKVSVEITETILLLLEGAYDDLASLGTWRGMSIWIMIFQLAILRRIVLRPKLVHMLVNAGCDIAEVWNCPEDEEDSWLNGMSSLDLFVRYARDPWMSNDLEVVLFLLTASAGRFGYSVNGQTVFDLASSPTADDNLETSYRQDLLFCALARLGIDVQTYSKYQMKTPRYTQSYTVWHHRCLCYLEKWDDFHLEDSLLQWLDHQPWPGNDTGAMYQFASGGGKDSMFEEAESRWRSLYNEFKVVQRAFEDEAKARWRIAFANCKARQKEVHSEIPSDCGSDDADYGSEESRYVSEQSDWEDEETASVHTEMSP